MTSAKPVIAWVYVGFYAALIFWFSSLSKPVPGFIQIQKYHADWIVHGVEYIPFGMLIIRALVLTWPQASLRNLMLVAVAVGFLYAASDEWHQSFVPLRDCNFYDWLADAIGFAVGIFIWNQLKGIKKYASD